MDTNFTNDTSQEVWHDTYKYHEDSDVNATLQRVAKAVASAEKPEKRDEVEKDFNEILENFAFCPGGRILANAGTEFTGTSMMNCFVGPKPEHDQDSIEGILEVLKTQSLTLKSEGGWGMNFSFIRPRGTFIHGVGIETPGAVKMMELFDTSSQVITEGSGTKSKTKKSKNKIRKGAMMAMLFCWHPDIEEFVTAKQSPGKLTKFNISVACTNEFMDLIVKIDELKKKGASQDEIDRIDTWDLVFPDTTHPEYKKAWTGNIVHWKEQGFPVIVHKTIKASALWDLISKSTYNRNEPGIYFVDIANKTHLLNYIKECDIQATNPCFSGETYIAVADGRSYVTIKELAEEGKDVPVYSYNIESGEVEIQYGRAPRVTGKDQKLLRITLDNGSFIDVTPEHKFATMDGRELKAFQLSKGDSLPRFIRAKEPVEKGGKDYYRIRTSTIDSSKRIFEHRLIAQFNDPAKWNSLYDANKKSGWVTDGIVVHHKDHNGLNNTPDNLEIMSWGAHTALHSSLSYPGSSNPMYGKQHSAETKEKIGLKTKLRCQDPEYKEKLRKSIKDSVTEETKAKISQRRTEYELNRRIDEAIKTGLTPILIDDELYVEKACEVTGKLFRVPWIHRTRSYGYDISPMQVQHIKEKALASSKAMYAEQAKHNLHLQVMAFKDLQQELGRIPLRKEFEKYCKEKKLPFRPNKKTNNEFIPKSWPDFLKIAAEYNHRVVSVEELPGLHTVYNITVDKNHTVGVVTKTTDSHHDGIFSPQCGEQSLPFGFVCLLGNINLTQFINKENTDVDYEKLSKYVKTSIRFLDNVNDVSNAPLPQYVKNIKEARRVGLGVMGWASLLYMLQIKYGSDEAANLKEKIMQTFCYSAVEQSIALAKEKGAFPLCDNEKVASNEFWNIVNLPQKLRDDIKKYGLRNSALFSIQPTGNTGVLCNLVSGGLEPVFLHEYVRTMIVPTCPEHLRNKLPQYWKGEFYETEMFTFVKEGDEQILRGVDMDGTVYKIDKHRGLTKEVLCEDYAVHAMKLANTWSPKAPWACTTESLSVDDHIREMQDFSKWLDSSCTKTVNLPNEYPFADFQDVYLKCYKTGVIKGFTTYRAGTMASVLAASTSNQDSGTLPKDRPDTLDAHVYNVKVKGERYLIVVGLHGESPFEVFGGKCPDDINVKDNKESKLIRYKYKNTSKYRLEVGSVDFNDFASNFTANEQTLFRMCSLILRKGTPLVELVVQLDKSNYEGIGSLTGAISRVLKRYVEAQTKYEGTCAACGSSNLVFAEGCLRCLDCDNSKCG